MIDEIYAQSDAYHQAHPDSPDCTTLNSQPIINSNPQPTPPIPQDTLVDYNSKEWKDYQLYIDSGGKMIYKSFLVIICCHFLVYLYVWNFLVADDVANENPNPMMIECRVPFSYRVRTLAGISKFAFEEYDDFVGIDTMRVDFARGWIVSICDSELFGKRILEIDDGTRQVKCYLRLDKDRYPLIRNPVEVGRLILLYKICCQFEVTFGQNIDYEDFTLHGGYSNILAVF